MTTIHGVGWAIFMVLMAGYFGVGLRAMITGRAPHWAGGVWVVLLGLGIIQSVTGTLAIALGGASVELTHWVYGPATLVVLLLSGTLLVDAAAKRLGVVICASSLLLLLLGWRLASTA